MKNIRNIILSVFLLTAFAVAQPSAIQSVKIDNSRVKAGQALTGVVTLTQPAPAEGIQVELWTDREASAPNHVFIPAGQTKAQFKVTTSHVENAKQLHVAALLPQSSVVSTFTVSPESVLTKK